MYVKVRVEAGAKRERVQKESDTLFLVSVREPASQNLANGRVRELIAGEFGVPVGKVRIVNGHQSPSKMLSVDIKK